MYAIRSYYVQARNRPILGAAPGPAGSARMLREAGAGRTRRRTMSELGHRGIGMGAALAIALGVAARNNFV